MQIWMRPTLARQIAEYAYSSHPYECCGVVLGIGMEAQTIVPIPNSAKDPTTQYRMDDNALSDVFFKSRREKRDLIAFYHSHPNSPPIPSNSDIQLAAYPDIPYMIVSLRGKEAELLAWQITREEVRSVELFISETPPAPQPPALTAVQKRAIIASIVIAFLFMLILSLSLLPPAPIIPAP